jgi:hypothetical protein
MTDQARQRERWADVTFIVLAAAAAVVLLYLGRHLTFWYDEWGSITFAGGVTDFLTPVNEHWSTFPLALYRITFAAFGLRSYMPYLAEVIALHLLAVAAAYVLARRRVGSVMATALMVTLLLLGAGSENLFWAFQTGFVGSVAFGLWALVLIESSSRAARVGSSALLIASLMSSGMGLVFLVVAFIRTILDPELRRNVVAIGPPAVVYLIWFSLTGRDGLEESRDMASLQELGRFVQRGTGHSVAEFSGLSFLPGGRALALALVAAMLLATLWAWLTKRRCALGAASLLGIIATYALIGLVRANLGFEYTTRSRYVYVVAFLFVLAAADLISLVRPWLSAHRRANRAAVAGFVLLLGSVFVANLDALAVNQTQARLNADVTRAYIELALVRGTEPWVDPDSVIGQMPPVPVLVATIRKHGSPLHDDFVPGEPPVPGSRAREIALLTMVGRGFRVTRAIRDAKPARLGLTGSEDVTVARNGSCFVLSNAGRDGAVTVSAPSGTRVRVTADSRVDGVVALGRELSPSRRIDLALVAGSPADVVIPDIGDGGRWRVSLDVPGATGRVSVCGMRLT